MEGVLTPNDMYLRRLSNDVYFKYIYLLTPMTKLDEFNAIWISFSRHNIDLGTNLFRVSRG